MRRKRALAASREDGWEAAEDVTDQTDASCGTSCGRGVCCGLFLSVSGGLREADGVAEGG
jgi:hypothetical protein